MSGKPLRIMVTEQLISRFDSILTRGGSDGHEWIMAAGWKESRIVEALGEVDILVSFQLSPSAARAAKRLRLLLVPGAGFENVAMSDLPPAVTVATSSNHGRSVAEHVIMVSLMLSRRVVAFDQQMRQGVWRNYTSDPTVPLANTLQGKVLGLVGLGEIGLDVARLAGAFGMSVQAVRQNPCAERPSDVAMDWVGGIDGLDHLLGTSDILVLTAPLNDSTRGLIGRHALETMKTTAFLINVARGAIVDEVALHAALEARSIAGAALDVWWSEVPGQALSSAVNRSFGRFDNVVLTPHQSGHTYQTFEGRARAIAENIRAFASGGTVSNVVQRGTAESESVRP